MELDLGCSAAVLRRRLNASRCTFSRRPVRSSDPAVGERRNDISNFKVSCCLTSSSSSSSSSSGSDTKSGGGNSSSNISQHHQQQPAKPSGSRTNRQRVASTLIQDWTDRLLLVLQPTAEDPSSRRRQFTSEMQRVRQAFCILFQPELLAKLLGNVPSLKAIANKTRCTVKLRDALLFKRLLRTGCMVKYMLFLVEGETRSQVEACLRFLEDFDSAFAMRRPWKGRSDYQSLVLRWNKHVPENTLLSIQGQRLMSTSRLFCCSPIGPNTGWLRPSAQDPSKVKDGKAPAGLLG